MYKIAPSELILNARGAIYHLDLRPEELADTIITVGDPDRVAEVSKHWDSIEVKRQHREFVTHTGYIGKKRVSCVATGIGPDNIDIVFNELDALVNIDLESRTVKPQLQSLNLIRIGTSGALQADIPVDSFVASSFGLGIDNLLGFYRYQPTEEGAAIVSQFMAHTQIGSVTHPYINAAGTHLLNRFAQGFHHGITVTCPGFYGPQGRVLRLGLALPELINSLTSFRYGPHRITNFEMETSAIYGLGQLLGHQCLSLSCIVANRVKQEFSNNHGAAVEKLITTALGIIETL